MGRRCPNLILNGPLKNFLFISIKGRRNNNFHYNLKGEIGRWGGRRRSYYSNHGGFLEFGGGHHLELIIVIQPLKIVKMVVIYSSHAYPKTVLPFKTKLN